MTCRNSPELIKNTISNRVLPAWSVRSRASAMQVFRLRPCYRNCLRHCCRHWRLSASWHSAINRDPARAGASSGLVEMGFGRDSEHRCFQRSSARPGGRRIGRAGGGRGEPVAHFGVKVARSEPETKSAADAGTRRQARLNAPTAYWIALAIGVVGSSVLCHLYLCPAGNFQDAAQFVFPAGHYDFGGFGQHRVWFCNTIRGGGDGVAGRDCASAGISAT